MLVEGVAAVNAVNYVSFHYRCGLRLLTRWGGVDSDARVGRQADQLKPLGLLALTGLVGTQSEQ